MTAKLAESIDDMRREQQRLAEAELYWVSRDMVDVVVGASETLPEWTPALAVPAPAGLLCWAKPAGRIPFAAETVSWDATWWWTRPDGILQLQLASRLTDRQDLLAPYGVSSPLWATTTVVVNSAVPRTAEARNADDASAYVSVIGAAWLLMGQPAVTQARTIHDSPATPEPAPQRFPRDVTIIELRRPQGAPGPGDAGATGRHYRRRWWVEGHWRQQACGPGRSQRKPVWIAPHVKGPADAPLSATDRVHVLRR